MFQAHQLPEGNVCKCDCYINSIFFMKILPEKSLTKICNDSFFFFFTELAAKSLELSIYICISF